MNSWRPRRWPLNPALARQYSCVDARQLPADGTASLVGLRITGRIIDLSRSGRIALVDLEERKPAQGSIVIAKLPRHLAQLVGFAGEAHVARYYAPDPEGCRLWPFAAEPRGSVSRHLLVRHEDMAGCILGTVVGVLEGRTREWSSWRRVEQRLRRAAPSAPAALTIEADTFDALRDKVSAAARVYDCIESPAELLGGSRSSGRELRAAIRHARSKGLAPRELAAVGGVR